MKDWYISMCFSVTDKVLGNNVPDFLQQTTLNSVQVHRKCFPCLIFAVKYKEWGKSKV